MGPEIDILSKITMPIFLTKIYVPFNNKKNKKNKIK